MRVVTAKRKLPRKWASDKDGVILEKDVALNSGKLRFKMLVFKDVASMARFVFAVRQWRIGSTAHAVTCELSLTVYPNKQPEYMEVDGRYFAMVCFCVKHLSAEVIAHEAVHVAFAYHRRVKRKDLWHDLDENEDEAICYPAGIAVDQINQLLHTHKLYTIHEKHCQRRIRLRLSARGKSGRKVDAHRKK